MYFKHILPFVCVIQFRCIESEDELPVKSKEEIDAETEAVFEDSHTIVALIDIVFTDGAKKTCTGSIIHENVVITVAHCFIHDFDYDLQPELTTSFVVIGTKKMFEAGYEQYLPIERIISHPKFKGWTADLALVYTFAGMTGSGKPGRVIRLGGERMTNLVDSNVTVFSWGKKDFSKSCEDEPDKKHRQTKAAKHFDCDESSEECENFYRSKTTVKKKSIRTYSIAEETEKAKLIKADEVSSSIEEEKEVIQRQSKPKELKVTVKIIKKENVKTGKGLNSQYPLLRQKVRLKPIDDSHARLEQQYLSRFQTKHYGETTTRKSRYLHSDELAGGAVGRGVGRGAGRAVEEKQIASHNNTRFVHKPVQESVKAKEILHTDSKESQETEDAIDTKEVEDKKEVIETIVIKDKKDTKDIKDKNDTTVKRDKRVKRVFNNWRRSMDNQNNVLTVETFGFVNMATCKRILENSRVTNHYEIKNGEIACYVSDDYHITENDSGAPAVRHGQLVAVTVGGAECDGDKVGIGLKMSCYCTWVSENLPGGGGNMNCCKNCCDVKHDDSKTDKKNEKGITYLTRKPWQG